MLISSNPLFKFDRETDDGLYRLPNLIFYELTNVCVLCVHVRPWFVSTLASIIEGKI